MIGIGGNLWFRKTQSAFLSNAMYLVHQSNRVGIPFVSHSGSFTRDAIASSWPSPELLDIQVQG